MREQYPEYPDERDSHAAVNAALNRQWLSTPPGVAA